MENASQIALSGGQLVIALFGALGGGAAFLAVVNHFLNKRKTEKEIASQGIKNFKEENDITIALKDNARKVVQEEMNRNKQLDLNQRQLEIEQSMRRNQGETLIQLAKDIGEAQGREKSCQEQLKEMKEEIRAIKERSEHRDEERYQETMKMLDEIRKLFAKCVIVPRESETT